MRLLLTWFGVLCCAGCSGCAGFINPTAESWVSVRGKVDNVQQGTKCTVGLFTEKGRLIWEQTVTPEFRRSFTIAPGDHKYYLGVTCAGQPGSFKSETYELGAGSKAVDLGTIVLTAQ